MTYEDGLRAAIKAIEEQMRVFLSDEFATGQPLSSWSERFACRSCIEAIQDLIDAGETASHEATP